MGKIFLQADIINGVTEVTSFDSHVTVLDQADFYDALKNVKENEIIATTVDKKDILEKIENDYGIH